MSEESPPEDDFSKEASEDVTEALEDFVKPKLNILRLRQEESFESVSNRGKNWISRKEGGRGEGVNMQCFFNSFSNIYFLN